MRAGKGPTTDTNDRRRRPTCEFSEDWLHTPRHTRNCTAWSQGPSDPVNGREENADEVLLAREPPEKRHAADQGRSYYLRIRQRPDRHRFPGNRAGRGHRSDNRSSTNRRRQAQSARHLAGDEHGRVGPLKRRAGKGSAIVKTFSTRAISSIITGKPGEGGKRVRYQSDVKGA
jgi:hypothetical protein